MENTISGLWKSNLPKKGWVYVDVKDTGKRATSCTWCGTLIRYVHSLEHSETGISTECGCICAENLTEDYVNPKQREKTLRGKQARIRTWVNSPRWLNQTPGYSKRRAKGFTVEISFDARKNGWSILLRQNRTLRQVTGTRVYQTLPEAKTASLDAINWAEKKLLAEKAGTST